MTTRFQITKLYRALNKRIYNVNNNKNCDLQINMRLTFQ